MSPDAWREQAKAITKRFGLLVFVGLLVAALFFALLAWGLSQVLGLASAA